MTKRHITSGSFEVLNWRKSSRSSGGAGNNCVEAGTWRKSSRSSSGAGNNCVEAGTCRCHGIAVRDSKHLATPPLTLTATDWTALLATVKSS